MRTMTTEYHNLKAMLYMYIYSHSAFPKSMSEPYPRWPKPRRAEDDEIHVIVVQDIFADILPTSVETTKPVLRKSETRGQNLNPHVHGGTNVNT